MGEDTADTPIFARVAQLLGHPARARMIERLLDGERHSAGELARAARVSAQSASMHLRQLLDAAVVQAEPAGRSRRYRLAGVRVAAAVEALGRVGSGDHGTSRPPVLQAFAEARTCYDHLAGRLGVRLLDALATKGYIVGNESYAVSEPGIRWLGHIGIDVGAVRGGRRPFILSCEDWTERRPHLAGALGAALLDSLVKLGWVARLPATRALRVTSRGRADLHRELGLDL